MEQKLSRLPLVVFVLAMLSPYGIALVNTAIFTTNQYWLFPLWIYLTDLGNWLGFGVFVPFFILTFQPLMQFLGLIWCGLGVYVSRMLQHVYDEEKDSKSLWNLTLRLLVIQVIVTIIVSFVAWYGWLIIVVPLPLHFLIVLYFTRLQIQQVESTQA
jgi:hypothetical protein